MLRWVAVALSIAITACAQLFGFHEFSQGEPDGSVMRDIGTILVPALHFDGSEPATLMFDDETIDTTSDPRCVLIQGACVVEADTIVVGGKLVAIGMRPLVLAALHTVTVTGTVDASSRRLGSITGAGAAATSGCAVTTAAQSANQQGGGGPGGSFGTVGGAGGSSESGSLGGVAGVIDTTPAVRGGCRGGDGASGSGSGVHGGQPGGAILLVAGDEIDILASGVLLACGAGGEPGTTGGGGGGGGAGGLVALDAPLIAVDGLVRAEGGGGAEGGAALLGAAGSDACVLAGAPGLGGAGAGAGGDGGRGSLGGNGSSGLHGAMYGGSGSGGGGGGGGGGAGWVWITQPIAGAGIISPAPTQR